MDKLMREIKVLKILWLFLTIVLLALAFIVMRMAKTKGHFTELTAERLNIVEANGKLRIIISNHQRQHPGIMNNKIMPARDRAAGLIFFNDSGDECGGLIFDNNRNSAGMVYSVDQYKNDQILQLQYSQETENGKTAKSYGMKIWDRDDRFDLGQQIDYVDSLKNLKDTAKYNAGMKRLGQLVHSAERLFVGKNLRGEVGLFLRDTRGVARLKIYINKENQPVMETLNEKGEKIKSFLFGVY